MTSRWPSWPSSRSSRPTRPPANGCGRCRDRDTAHGRCIETGQSDILRHGGARRPPGRMPMKLFVSYNRDDRTAVNRIVAELRSHQHEVWTDEHLTAAATWWAHI